MINDRNVYNKNNKAISNILEKLINISKNDQFQLDEINNDFAELLEDFKQNKYSIVTVGEFGRGKSMFINALLGKKVLPTSAMVCTATINLIKYKEAQEIYVTYRSGKRVKVEYDELSKIVTKKNNKAPDIKWVEIFYNTEFSKDGVEIVDTPGVNDIDENREKVTFEFIPRAHAAILILDCEQVLTASEMNFLQVKINRYIDKVFVIINKIDNLDDNPEGLGKAITHLKKNLLNIKKLHPDLTESDEFLFTEDKLKIFPLSAKKAMNAKKNNDAKLLKESKFQDFEKELLHFLFYEKGSILLKNFIFKAEKIIYNFKNQLELKNKLFLSPVNEKKSQAEDILRKLKNVSEKNKHILSSFNNKLSSARSKAMITIETAVSKIPGKINRFIKNNSNSELKKLREDVAEQFMDLTQLAIEQASDDFNTKLDSIIEKIKYDVELSLKEVNKMISTKFNFNFSMPEIDINVSMGNISISNIKTENKRSYYFAIGGFLLGGPIGAMIGNIIDSETAETVSNYDEVYIRFVSDVQNKINKSKKKIVDKFDSETKIVLNKVSKGMNNSVQRKVDDLKRIFKTAIEDKEKSEGEYNYFKEQYTEAHNYLDLVLKNFKTINTELEVK